MRLTLKAAFPQLHLCLTMDSLYGCGRVFALCQKHHWHFVVTFKAGRSPDLWPEFQARLKLQPKQVLTTRLGENFTALGGVRSLRSLTCRIRNDTVDL